MQFVESICDVTGDQAMNVKLYPIQYFFLVYWGSWKESSDLCFRQTTVVFEDINKIILH